MTPRRVALALWIAFAFVTWNVVFDRAVAHAAIAFTRAQIDRYEQGAAVASIDRAFTPYVRRAAVTASAWTALVLVIGAAAIHVAYPRQPL